MQTPIMFRDPKIIITSDTKYVDVSKLEGAFEPFILPTDSMGRGGEWYKNKRSQILYLKRRKYLAIILNELIGEYLSLHMGLDTIKYKLAYEKDNIVGLLSNNFRKKSLEYIYLYELTADEREFIDLAIRSRAKTKRALKYKQKLANYLIRDYYANQGDRVFNTLFYRKNNMLYLGPLFDYEGSFMNPEDDEVIMPILFDWQVTTEVINILRTKDECFDKAMDKIYDFNMETTLEQIKGDYKIRIPDVVMEHYVSYDEERKKLMKENIKK